MRYPAAGALVFVALVAMSIPRMMAVPVAVAPAEFATAQQPQIDVATDGTVYVAFGRGEEIFLAVSRDAALTFAPPVRVAQLPKLALGRRRGPRLAVSGERITLTAISHETGNLLAFHSPNAGRTWDAAVPVNDVNRSAAEGLAGLASGPDGRMYATWLDHRAGRTEVYGSESVDAGRTWGTNVLVYRSPEKTVCECCHPSVAYNAKGDLVVMFRNALEGNRDLWMVTRPAGQSAFGNATRQGMGHWALAACPMDGGAIVPQRDGSFASVWRRDKEIFLSLPAQPEINFGEGMQPVALAAPAGVQLFWQRGSDLLRASTAPGAVPLVVAAGARFPTLAASPRDGMLFVAYESTAQNRPGLFVEVVR